MNIKRSIIAIAAAFVMLAALTIPLPVYACAEGSSSSDGYTSSDVQCVVEPVYEFALPPDALFYYPQTQLMIGRFEVGNLLLASGEKLSVELGTYELIDSAGNSLPFTVSFEPPDFFDERQSGKAYSISAMIDEDGFNTVAGGTYVTTLVFSVVSHPASKVVWQDEVVFSVVKPEHIAGENVPTTAITVGTILWWGAATVVALIMVIMIYMRKKMKKDQQKSMKTDLKNTKE